MIMNNEEGVYYNISAHIAQFIMGFCLFYVKADM